MSVAERDQQSGQVRAEEDAANADEPGVLSLSRVRHRSHRTKARNFLLRMPGAQEAIRHRMAQHPEYRTWLEHFSPGVFTAVQEPETE